MADFGAGIIMQNAAMRGQFADRLFRAAQLAEQGRQFNQTMDYNRTKPKDLSMGELDLQMVQRYQAGDRSPEVMRHLQARDAMEGMKTQYTDDGFGRLVPRTVQNPYGLMLGSSGGMRTPGFVPEDYPGAAIPEDMGAPSSAFEKLGQSASGATPFPPQPTAMGNDVAESAALNKLMETAQYQESTPNITLTPMQFERLALGEATVEDIIREMNDGVQQAPQGVPTLPPASGGYAGSPTEQIEQGKARADVLKAGSMLPVDAAKADINASGKMAENYGGELGTEAAKEEARMKGLGELKQSLDAMIPLAEKAPSGVFENAGAWATNKAGFPSGAANAAAAFDATKAITGLQSRINFLKGQGTITDKEAEQAMAFIPDPNDSASVKVTKLKTASAAIQTMIDGKSAPLGERQKGKPGFKYLGVKK